MATNTEININSLPVMKYKRSKFKYYKNYKTTFNCGDLIPTYVNELVQPGDTFNMYISLVCRMMTPYQPVMDNCWLETFAFAVPWLDVWNKAKEFWGENPNGAWTNNQVEYATPRIKVPANTAIHRHSLLSYFGFPRASLSAQYECGGGLSVTTYLAIYNEWFRNINYIAPKTLNMDGTTITYTENDVTKGGIVLKVQKPKTRYIVGLPEPQRSPDGAVTIPLGTTAPVYGNGKRMPIVVPNQSSELRAWQIGQQGANGSSGNWSSVQTTAYNSNTHLAMNGAAHVYYPTKDVLVANGLSGADSPMFADLTEATAATISALRLATAVQQIYEAMGAYGALYRQIIMSLWGTSVSDTAMHIPEFLGSHKTLINMDQVTATTDGTNQNLGSTGAMSLTNDSFHLFTKSFREHSVIMVLNCVRTDAHYAQGLPRQFLKSLKFDYYWNKLAGLSFQPVYKAEIKATATNINNLSANVLSFLPAWSEYRNEQDQLTSMFNPDDPLFLEQWTYVNKFTGTNEVAMGQSFIEENTENIDRTLYEKSTNVDNFMLDMTFAITKITEVPFYGTPGLTRF